MTTALPPSYMSPVDGRNLAALNMVPVGEPSRSYTPSQSQRQSNANDFGYSFQQDSHPKYSSMRSISAPDRSSMVRQSSYGDFPNSGAEYDPAVGQGQAANGSETLPSPYDRPTTNSARPGSSRSQRQYSPSPYQRETPPRHAKNDSGVITDVRSAAGTPVDVLSETNTLQGQPPTPLLQNGVPKHPSISASNANGGGVPPRHAAPIIPSSAAPSYKPPNNIPISSTTRAIAQQPTYITPPSSPTPIAVNAVYSYAADINPAARYAAQQAFNPIAFKPNDGREICVECAMRDQDMADVDVTSPGIWERESDAAYHDLVRLEMEEEEERVRARESNSSSESQPIIVRPADPNRPRAKGNRLTEPNVKLWLSMNPREPQARQQTLDLYVKTQTALLEAEALARARAIQESRLLESKLKDTYESLRRSTYDMPTGGAPIDENGMRLKASQSSRRSVSGPTPRSIGSLVVDTASHARNPSQSRDITLLENGMIVEEVDVRKEERERRREERRERSRNRKTSRGSGGDRNGDVMSMYSAHSPLPYQTDSGFYTSASNGSAAMLAREQGRPMSMSASSTRATSMLTGSQPLTPPPGSASFVGRPPSARIQSQISLVDSQSISSASMGANRRSKFFAFRNWSEAWKSRESFAPSGVMSMNGSMMDMHVALDREREAMQMHQPTMDLGNMSASAPHVNTYPRRASVSGDRNIPVPECNRPKKRKGLAKLWGLVTGNKTPKQPAQQGREVVQLDRPEDDAPLAPPPPLSYLVNRTPRERTISSSSRRASIPSGPCTPQVTNTLPTPTSIRSTWIEDGSRPMNGGALTAHTEESASNVNEMADSAQPVSVEAPKGITPMMSEPDMRQRVQQTQQEVPQSQMQLRPSTTSSTLPRPISMYSIHKSLPPLPNEAMAAQSIPTPVDMQRPRTMFDMTSQAMADSPEELVQPNPAFRHDGRRQSFGGTGSRPDLTTPGMGGTFPMNAPNGARQIYGAPQDPYAYSPYAEMGALPVPASRSVNRFDIPHTEGEQRIVGKRRSRFGLSSLLGKVTGGGSGSLTPHSSRARPSTSAGEMRVSVASPPPQGPPTSESDPSVTDYGMNGTSSRSKHGANGGFGSRMSVASRKAIEELVDQDPKFVAYRYPSVDQNIAILR